MDPEKTVDQLQKENDDLRAELEQIKSVNDELTKKVEELSAGQTATEAASNAQKEAKPGLPTETFEVNSVAYKFLTPVFVYKGQKILAEQAITDTALLSELVAKGIGVIAKA